jgi:hypothetical protein
MVLGPLVIEMMLQTALGPHFSLVSWSLVLGTLVSKLMLQTALNLHFSLFLGSWSSGIWNEAANFSSFLSTSVWSWSLVLWYLKYSCKLHLTPFQSGPWSSVIFNDAANCTCSPLQSGLCSLVLWYLQWCFKLHLISTSVWSLVLGPLVFEMMLQTLIPLHFSLFLGPWSSGIWNDAASCTQSPLPSGPRFLILWYLEWGCELLKLSLHFSLVCCPWSSAIWNEAANCTCSSL